MLFLYKILNKMLYSLLQAEECMYTETWVKVKTWERRDCANYGLIYASCPTQAVII